MTALAAQDVTVRIGSKTLLDSVSLAVTAGESVALVGPNGAGKSTLLRILSGELKPTSGTMQIKGRPLAGYAPRDLALHRAVLSQSVTVAFPFTVREVVRMGAGDRHGRAVDELAERALADVELTAFADRVITTLSGGEQQRAHLARVLVQLGIGEKAHGPGVLLLDEPTAGLAPADRAALMRVVRARVDSGGVAVLFTEHDMDVVFGFADRVVVLDRGRVIAQGTPDAIRANDDVRRAYLGDPVVPADGTVIPANTGIQP